MSAFLEDRMTQAPATCMMCGCGNVPDETGTVGPFANLGIDYNWGDSGYLCGKCVGNLAVLFDWISPDTKKDMDREIAKLNKKIHDLEADLDLRRRRERKALRAARA